MRHPRPWDHVQVVPVAYHPPLPWTPTTKSGEFPGHFWLLPLAGIALTAVDLFSADELGWTDWLSGPGLLVMLWGMLKPACERWTIGEDGLVVTGLLLRRWYPWAAITGVSARKYEVAIELGRRPRRTARFDGTNGRPSAAEVAGVVERVRSVSTSGLERGRLSLSWGAAVFLPAVLVVVAGSVWALSKG